MKRDVIEVNAQQLPLSCPLPEQPLWSAHPRIFLPIEERKKVVCPYCGARYHLVGKVPAHG